MLEDVYADLRDDDALDAMKAKLHKEYDDEKAFDRAYQNALIKLCTQIQPVEEKELERLAKERAQKIQTYLVTEKSLAMNRILMGNVIKQHSSDDKTVQLKLNITVQSSDK